MALLYHFTGQDYTSRGLNNASLTKGSTFTIVGGCKTGKGFEFDGTVNSAFEINGITDSEKFSIDFWCYTGADVTTQQTIFSDYSQLNGRINIRVINGTFTAFTYNTSGEFTNVISGTIIINTWYHVAATVDTIGNISIYLNGVLQKQLAITGTVRSSSGLYSIGKRYTNGNLLLTGTKICNFKYYNHVLSKKEIREDYKSLILHYPLNKAITDTVLDVSGFKRHITNLTNNTVTLDSKSQVYSASLKNDGTQALMGDCDLTDLNGIPEISISFRAYKQNTDTCAILTNRTVLGNGIAIFVSSTQIFVDLSTRNSYSYNLPLNEWVHVCVTQSATEQKLYVNGVLVSTMTASTLTGIGNYTSISNSNISGGAIDYILNGNVQDIRFYATALTANDVRQLYESRMLVDNNANVYTYELIEGSDTVGIDKYGQMHCDELIENEDGTFSIKSDKTIKVNSFKEI